MGISRLQNQNRADRIIIALALVILFMAGGAFYFDGWMWGGRRSKSEKIGTLFFKSGDVRMKFEGDLKWQKASSGQEITYNDSFYAGPNSNAKLQLGESEMTVSENTLVVLRRQENTNFMNLSYGSLFGKVGKNEKVLIDTGGSAKPIELNTTSNTQIMVSKKGKRTELQVVSGEASITINGKVSKVNKSSRVVVEEDKPEVESEPKVEPQVEQVNLLVTKPLRDQVIYSEEPARIDFQWKWSNERRPAAGENYFLEFASSPTFTKVHTKREIVGKLSTSFNAAESLSLFFRVRGPRGELSQVERVNFVRLRKPVIIAPVAGAKFIVPADTRALIPVEFRRPESARVWYQVARDPEFKTVVSNDNTQELKTVRELPVGGYFLRARSAYADQRSTGWTEAVPFAVERKIEPLRLAPLADNSRIVIPNSDYPASLYGAAPKLVRDFLARKGFLADYFPFREGSFDELHMKFESNGREAQDLSQTTPAWPREKLHPGRFAFTYQASKKGFEPTDWSSRKKVEITMEPPRPVGDVKFVGVPNEAGESEGDFSFTPLLFAKTYDVEIARDPSMRNPHELKVDAPNVKTMLSGENYWRARARDGQGRIISEFSPAYKLRAPVPQMLARNPEPVVRRPTAVEKSVAKVERLREEPFEKNGWWVWVGSGENYVDYRQSIPGRGTLSDHHLKGPSEYVETGFAGNSGFGGVLSFKHTPGEIQPNDAPIDNGSYSWTTISGEALLRKVSKFNIFDSPIVYGLRMGFQQHRLPFVHLDENADLAMKSNTVTTASAGLTAEWSRRRWTYYWMMRYQYPLSASADGAASFSIDPVFAFDGSIGTSYNLTRQLKAGLFWYGQWHQFGFTYDDGSVLNKGFQSLFYSNFDLRLGFEF